MNRIMEPPCSVRCVVIFADRAGRTALLEYVSSPFSSATPAQQICHVAILGRDSTMDTNAGTFVQVLYEIEGIDLGASLVDFSDISW